jgi:hypothetical protein
VSVSFRSDCPLQYQPAGFGSAKDHMLNPQDWLKLWQLPTDPDITFNAAHHAVQISARNKEYDEKSESQLQDTIMGKHIHDMQRTSSQYDNGLQSTMPVSATPGNLTQIAIQKEQKGKKRTYEEAVIEDEASNVGSKASQAEIITPRRRRKSISKLINLGTSSPASTCTDNEQEYRRGFSPDQSAETELSEDDFT